MFKPKRKFVLIGMLLLVAALVALPVVHVMAAPGVAVSAAQESTSPPAVGVIDAVFVLTCVAFFKTQFNLTKWYAIGLAGAVCLLVFFGPYIQTALNLPQDMVDGLVGLVRLFMFTAGGYDLAADAGPKVFANIVKK